MLTSTDFYGATVRRRVWRSAGRSERWPVRVPERAAATGECQPTSCRVLSATALVAVAWGLMAPVTVVKEARGPDHLRGRATLTGRSGLAAVRRFASRPDLYSPTGAASG